MEEQRRFSAPQAEWDASRYVRINSFCPILTLCRSAPTPGGRPEAPNFPSQTYEFTSDTNFFQPPKYPDAPKDMYYQVPAKVEQAAKLKPIFPWEEHAPKPTRVFPKEFPIPEAVPERTPEDLPTPSAKHTRDTSVSSEATRDSSYSSTTEGDPWNTFSRTNAWDAMPDIERYVQALHVQQRRGKVQVLHQSRPPTSSSKESGEESAFAERRPSMRLTDFPTEFERPSLPVTPAPRRPSFWGEERDESGQLPAAEGVPNQKDWVSDPQRAFASLLLHSPLRSMFSWRCQYCGQQNPVQRLEELQKRQSEVLQNGPNLDSEELPKREMPENAVPDSPPATAAAAATITTASAKGEEAALSDPAELTGDKVFVPSTTASADPPAPAPTGAKVPLPKAQPKKGILKAPSFEVGFEPPEDDSEVEPVDPVDINEPPEVRGTDSAEYAIA